MAPNWDGWPAVIVAQNADVESHSACLLSAEWRILTKDNWNPEMYDTGLTWDFCLPEVPAEALFGLSNKMSAWQKDLWSQVDSEETQWWPVNYPN